MPTIRTHINIDLTEHTRSTAYNPCPIPSVGSISSRANTQNPDNHNYRTYTSDPKETMRKTLYSDGNFSHTLATRIQKEPPVQYTFHSPDKYPPTFNANALFDEMKIKTKDPAISCINDSEPRDPNMTTQQPNTETKGVDFTLIKPCSEIEEQKITETGIRTYDPGLNEPWHTRKRPPSPSLTSTIPFPSKNSRIVSFNRVESMDIDSLSNQGDDEFSIIGDTEQVDATMTAQQANGETTSMDYTEQKTLPVKNDSDEQKKVKTRTDLVNTLFETHKDQFISIVKNSVTQIDQDQLDQTCYGYSESFEIGEIKEQASLVKVAQCLAWDCLVKPDSDYASFDILQPNFLYKVQCEIKSLVSDQLKDDQPFDGAALIQLTLKTALACGANLDASSPSTNIPAELDEPKEQPTYIEPLYYCGIRNNFDAVRALVGLKRNIDTNSDNTNIDPDKVGSEPERKENHTVLWELCETTFCNDDLFMAELLIDLGADFKLPLEGYDNSSDFQINTPLAFAVKSGNTDMVRLLLEKGANLTDMAKFGSDSETNLFILAENKLGEAIKFEMLDILEHFDLLLED